MAQFVEVISAGRKRLINVDRVSMIQGDGNGIVPEFGASYEDVKLLLRSAGVPVKIILDNVKEG